MVDRIGGRKRDREEIGAGPAPEIQRIHSVESHLHDQLVHERRRAHQARGLIGVGREHVRKNEIPSGSFDTHVVRFLVCRIREKRRPGLARVFLGKEQIVEFPHPVRKIRGIVAARGELTIARIPVNLLLCPADGQDSSSVLGGDGQGARFGIGSLDPVEERRSLKSRWRGARAAGKSEKRRVVVEDTHPVRGDARGSRKPAGKKACVAWGGLGDSVILMRVTEPGSAVNQSGKSARKLRSEPGEVVLSKAVDRDHHDQGGFSGGSLGMRGRYGDCNCAQGVQEFRHAPI